MKFYFEKFRTIRKHKNISVKEISISLNKHRVTVWAWEKGKQKPCLSDIKELSKILHVDLADISDIKTDGFDEEDNWSVADNINAPLSIEDRVYIKGLEQELAALRKNISYIKREKEELQNIVNNIQTFIYKKDLKLRFSFANRAFTEILNIPLHKLSGSNNHSVFIGEETNKLQSFEQRVLRGEKISNHEIIIPGTKKRRKGFFSGSPIYGENGSISGIAVSIEDITDKSVANTRYRQLEEAVNFSQDVLWIKDMKQKNAYSFISNSIDNITGYKIKHFHNNVKFLLDNVVHPEAKKRVSEFYKKGNWKNPIDYKVITAEGKTKYLREKCYFENGMQFGVIEDRTSKVEAEKCQTMLLDIINKMPYAIWVSGGYGNRIDIVTDTFENFFRGPKHHFAKHPETYMELIHPEDEHEFKDWKESIGDKKWWEYRSSKTKKTALKYRLLLHGKTIWVEEQIFSDMELRKRGIRYGIIRDITKEFENSTTLRLLKDVIEKVNDIVWICTPPPNAKYLFINDAVEKIWGRSHVEFKGAKKWLDFVHPDDRNAESEAIERDEFPMFTTYRIIRPDGAVRKLQSSSFRDIDENNNVVDFGVIRDITDRKD